MRGRRLLASGADALGRLRKLFDLIEVHVAVDIGAVGVDHAHVGVVLGHGRQAAELGGDGREFGRRRLFYSATSSETG